jgi:hypothetical protein
MHLKTILVTSILATVATSLPADHPKPPFNYPTFPQIGETYETNNGRKWIDRLEVAVDPNNDDHVVPAVCKDLSPIDKGKARYVAVWEGFTCAFY